jgi:hypothetical protein
MRRFQEAWDVVDIGGLVALLAVDIGGLVALLADDALLTMPPEGVAIPSAAAIGTLFATAPMDGRIDRIRLRPATADQPALAAYAEDEPTGEHRAYGLMVFAIAGDRVAGTTGFPEHGGLYARVGLHEVLRAGRA